MLSRLARISYNPSLFRIPTIATILLYSRTRGSALSLIRWRHAGRRRASFASPSLNPEEKKNNKPRHVSATRLSDKDYVVLVNVYFEAVVEYAGYMQEEGSEITSEQRNNVITITAPGIGNYILELQHSTKRIRLNSPISGSNSFDWFENGEKQDGDDDISIGQWLQLSDGTNLSEVLNSELGMEMEMYWFY